MNNSESVNQDDPTQEINNDVAVAQQQQHQQDQQDQQDQTVELSLEDRFADSISEMMIEAGERTSEDVSGHQKAEAGNMPNVLVDEGLLSEIASIPDRFGFKIGDVADMLGIKQYVLRYWEQEFDILRPKKASNNQRLYTKKDVENAYLIRKLLYRDKFSIEGARRALKDVKFAVKKEKDFHSVVVKIEHVQEKIRGLVQEIQNTRRLFN